MEILYSPEQIRQRTAELAAEILDHYTEMPVVVPVLYGALPFFNDLCRHFPADLETGFIRVQSRLGELSGPANVYTYEGPALKGRHVLFVEDVVDTGATYETLVSWSAAQGALGREVVSITLKPKARTKGLVPRWVGFQAPEVFLLGYGMDIDNRYRNAPAIGHLPGKD